MKVEVHAYYMIETESACFGGYESYEEVQKFARIEKKQHPNDTVKIIHETTISTELEEVEMN